MDWLYRFLVICIIGRCVQAAEVVLLDSNNVTFGNWTSVQHDGDVIPHPQQKALYMWSTESEEDINKLPQLFFACTYRRGKNQSNWLRSPFIAIQDTALVSLEIEYEVTPCTYIASHPHCKEYISVYYRFAESSDSSDPINGTGYKQLLLLPQNKTLPLERRKIAVSIDVGVSSKKGMFVAFQDTGSCTYLYRIIIRFHYCSLTAQDLTLFPRTVVGNSSLHIMGKCQTNASSEQSSAPWKLCLVNGEWGTVTGSCGCNAGYELKENVCKACNKGTYKDSVGNFTCHPCPPNGLSDHEGSTNCSHVGNYFRVINADDPAEACTEISSTSGLTTTRCVTTKFSTSTTKARSNHVTAVIFSGIGALIFIGVVIHCIRKAMKKQRDDRIETKTKSDSFVESVL